MESQNFHLIFGSGPVGMAIMDELLSRKIPVKLASRSGKAVIPTGVEVLKVDAADSAAVRRTVENAAVVYNCTNVPYYHWIDLLLKIHRGIIEGVTGTTAKLVVMENLYMYGATHGKTMTEDLPYNPTSRKGGV